MPDCPDPNKPIDCGLPIALSETITDPLREPGAVGMKVTAIEQLAAGGSTPLALPGGMQVFVWTKSPVVEIPRRVRAAVPALFTVMVCGELVVPTICCAKVRLAGEKLATGATPMPARLTVWGLLLGLSVITSVPARLPIPVGVKDTFMEQLAPAPSEPVALPVGMQVFV